MQRPVQQPMVAAGETRPLLRFFSPALARPRRRAGGSPHPDGAAGRARIPRLPRPRSFVEGLPLGGGKRRAELGAAPALGAGGSGELCPALGPGVGVRGPGRGGQRERGWGGGGRGWAGAVRGVNGRGAGAAAGFSRAPCRGSPGRHFAGILEAGCA